MMVLDGRGRSDDGREIVGKGSSEDVRAGRVVADTACFATRFLSLLNRGGCGVTPFSTLQLLGYLHAYGATKMSDLARELGISNRNMTTFADRLEPRGLVRRIPHPTDRRASLLELTDEGRRAAVSERAPTTARIFAAFDVLDAEELRSYERIVEKLARSLEPESARQRPRG